jgi:hypothetical protein
MSTELDKSMLSTALLAINDLNKKYDTIIKEIELIKAATKIFSSNGFDINTIISNSLESVRELSKNHSLLEMQIKKYNDVL